MSFSKTLFTLLLLTFSTILKASTSDTVDSSSLTDQPAPIKKLTSKSSKRAKTTLTLQDASNRVEEVEPEGDSTIVPTSPSQGQMVPLVSNQFKGLIEQGNYKEIEKLGKDMGNDKFLKQLIPVMTEFEHYKNLFGYLNNRYMVPKFLVRGNIELIKKVLAESRIVTYVKHMFSELVSVYDEPGTNEEDFCIDNDHLPDAIHLAFKEEAYDRAVDFFVARHGRVVKNDDPSEQDDSLNFLPFMDRFLARSSGLGEDTMPIKRFLSLRGEELSRKHPAILETLYRRLVTRLKRIFFDPKLKELLIDLMWQPFLLKLAVFAEEILSNANDFIRISFVEHGCREIMQEGLKEECLGGGRWLWQVMKKEFSTQFSGDYPHTDELRAAVCSKLPTRQQLEEQWIAKNFPGFLKKAEEEVFKFVPIVLVKMIIEYARPTWIDTPNIKSS